MSRAYQLRLSQSLTHHVRVEDGIEGKLELLGILAPERTAELLGAELASRGFAVEGELARKELVSDGERVEIEVELSTGAVRVRGQKTESVDLEASRTIRAYDDVPVREEVRKEVEQELGRTLEAEARARDEAAADALSARLEQALAAIRPELDAAVNATTRAALREKAASLGQILEVSESASGEMTIRVRVGS